MEEWADSVLRFGLTLAVVAVAYGRFTTIRDLAVVLGLGALIAAIWLWESEQEGEQ